MNDTNLYTNSNFIPSCDTDSQQTAIERTIDDSHSVIHQHDLGKDDGHSINKDNFDDIYAAHNLAYQNRPLTILEKRFLLAVERGDLPAVKR